MHARAGAHIHTKPWIWHLHSLQPPIEKRDGAAWCGHDKSEHPLQGSYCTHKVQDSSVKGGSAQTHSLTLYSLSAFPAQLNCSLKRTYPFCASHLIYDTPFSHFALCSHKYCLHHTCRAPAHSDSEFRQDWTGSDSTPNSLYSRWRTRTVAHSFPAFTFIPVALQNAQKYLASTINSSCTLKTPVFPSRCLRDAEWGKQSVFG